LFSYTSSAGNQSKHFGNFVATPVIVDAMFQTGGLLESFTTNQTVLPYRIHEMKIYRDLEKYRKYYCITEKVESGGGVIISKNKLHDKTLVMQ
jgi:hypothetical protein